MPLYCKICSNLMMRITTSDEFKYKCNQCGIFELPNNQDTLIYERDDRSTFAMYSAILREAGNDPVNPLVEIKCKCGHNRARQIRLGDEMRIINTCVKCNHQWIEGTE